jgi:hypothetical protein
VGYLDPGLGIPERTTGIPVVFAVIGMAILDADGVLVIVVAGGSVEY